MIHRPIGRGVPALFVALVLGLCLSSPARAASGTSVDDILGNPSLQALAQHKLHNHVDAADLKSWRDTCTKEEAAAFDFLFAWLPPSDLSSWRASQILSDIRLALSTRREASWSRQIPDRIFYTYVLPHRVAQEPIQPWRPRLHELLSDRVRGQDLRGAALEVNRFCREWATFQPTSIRDQGPLTTMERGRGRCEEETIFYICAARSVGIPARPCYTPWWMASDNNHAWVEVFTGDGWHYLGACEPAADLDQAWFTEPARRCGLVLAVGYGEATPAIEDVYALDKGTTLFNVTPCYSPSGKFRTTSAAAVSAGPTDSITVHLHVFNSGCLMEMAHCAPGQALSLGAGEYVATWEARGIPQAALVTIQGGEETVLALTPDHPKAHALNWMERPFWLHIPIPPNGTAGSTGPSAEVAPLVQSAHELTVVQRDLLRSEQGRIADRRLSRIASRVCSEEAIAALLARLSPAGIRTDRWAAFLAATSAEAFAPVRSLLLEMDDKDLFECDTSSARAAVRGALEVKSWWKDRGVVIPDTLWSAFVLSPRIEDQPADLALWTNLPFLVPNGVDSLSAGARACHQRLAQSFRETAPSRLGSVATPSETWLSTTATPAAARVALVGLLRRNGIPARVDEDHRWVEYWSGRWRPLDPFRLQPLEDQRQAIADAYMKPGLLEARILEQGHSAQDAEEIEDVCLAHFVQARFRPLWRSYSIQSGVLRLELEPGQYWLFGGRRNHTGSPRVVARRFEIKPGERTKCELDLGIPVAEWDAQDLATRAVSPEGAGFLRALADERPAGAPAPILVFAWKPSCEPCQRTAESLRHLGREWARTGGTVISLQLADGGSSDRDLLSPGGDHTPLCSRSVSSEELERLFGPCDPANLPLLVLLDGTDRTRLFLEGMQLSAPPLIRRALSLP